MKNSNLTNIFSNYGSKIWSILSGIVFIPIYINILGIENYAIIGLYSLLLGIISFADSGMSSAVIKEFSLDQDPSIKYSLLKKIENLYAIICLSIILVIIIFSDNLANIWLQSDKISKNNLSFYISLIGCGVCIQLLSSLYSGALFGLGKQVKANLFQVIWNVFKAGMIIPILIIFNLKIEFYLIWQIICNLIYLLILRYNVIETLNKECDSLINCLDRIPPEILNYIGGMSLIAIISSINSQADKVIASTFFSLKIFGYYNIASIISQIPVIVISPLVLFIFPIFSKLSKDIDYKKLIISFKKISFLFNLIIIPTSFILLFYTQEILKLWMGQRIDVEILPKLISLSKLLTLGSFFLGMQFPLYYLLLSKGRTKYTLVQGLIQISLGLPLLIYCAKYFGLVSVGFPWIIINLGSYIYLNFIVFKGYIKISYFSFFREIIFMPFLISFVTISIFYLLYKYFNIYFLAFAIMSTLISVFVNIAYSNYLNKVKVNSVFNLYNFPE
jgi:O-antigen/teichoic acid export membrane protein